MSGDHNMYGSPGKKPVNSRAKGQRSERELAKLLTDELGVVVTRNTDPRHVSKGDILSIPGYSIEVKRRERLERPTWWKQAVRQAAAHDAEPLVFYRQTRKPWRALITGQDGQWVDVEWDMALDQMRDKLARLFGVYQPEFL